MSTMARGAAQRETKKRPAAEEPGENDNDMPNEPASAPVRRSKRQHTRRQHTGHDDGTVSLPQEEDEEEYAPTDASDCSVEEGEEDAEEDAEEVPARRRRRLQPKVPAARKGKGRPKLNAAPVKRPPKGGYGVAV